MAGGGCEGSGGRQRLAGTDGRTGGRAGAGPGEAALPTGSPPPSTAAAARRGPGRAGGDAEDWREEGGGGRERRGAGHAGRWGPGLPTPGRGRAGDGPTRGPGPGQSPSERLRVEPRVWGSLSDTAEAGRAFGGSPEVVLWESLLWGRFY